MQGGSGIALGGLERFEIAGRRREPRLERPEVAQALGINQPATPKGVPVVYQLDFNNAANVFAATNLEIMPEDVIYVPLAGAAEARKFFEFVQSVTRVVYDVSVTSAINVD